MKKKILKSLAQKLTNSEENINNVIFLMSEGATIPFIARYRKEKTGGLDEVQIEKIQLEYDRFLKVEDRKEYILKKITSQDKLTKDLQFQIENAETLESLDDLYLPFKSKRKTKAEIARNQGLESLAKIILRQDQVDLHSLASNYKNDKLKTVDEVLSGTRDIIAEYINEDNQIRRLLRKLFYEHSYIISEVIKTKKKQAIKYKDYFKVKERLQDCPSHRFLAIMRGKDEKYLRVRIIPSEQEALNIIKAQYKTSSNESGVQVDLAIKDSYERLLSKSLERETKSRFKEKADGDAIEIFTQNLEQLLLEAPLGNKRVLAIDPGFRTGCKVVALDEYGNYLANMKINILKNHGQKKKFLSFVNNYKPEVIAIGNGTASREAEKFIKSLDIGLDIHIVSEDGASIYSASDVAREEFPDLDITVRGAISIGRRLMDPLSELVKIEPKSLGVGQYQYDVDQTKLKYALDRTVEHCVNKVGVNLNTASKYLLRYVSGLGEAIAEKIVDYRKHKGEFTNRTDLLNVDKLGTKSFEQSAGFLRIPNSENPLDNSQVHPEHYDKVLEIAMEKGVSVRELVGHSEVLEKLEIERFVDKKIGIPTLEDIIKELRKPGVDPRGKAEKFAFSNKINDIKDLEVGMVVPGIVTNMTSFGAFIDIGIHNDGLLHISEIQDSFVKNPSDVISLHEKFKVKIIEIDEERGRISLSKKQL